MENGRAVHPQVRAWLERSVLQPYISEFCSRLQRSRYEASTTGTLDVSSRLRPAPLAPHSVLAETSTQQSVASPRQNAVRAPEARAMLAGFIEQVGRLCAPAGELVSEQLKFIVPE